jgi:uncharacterized membrane protein
MNQQPLDPFIKLLIEKIEKISKQEQEIFHRLLDKKNVAKDTNKAFEDELTFGQRVADKVAAFGGSWTFIIIFATILFTWIIFNTFILAKYKDAFDPYPYILLNLILSMLAAIQAPIIMMSQNRQAAKDRLDALHDYQVNLKAEIEIEKLHQKLDELREKQWLELVEMQQEQIRLLTKLLEEKIK